MESQATVVMRLHLFVSFRLSHAYTHTDTHMYIYTYLCGCKRFTVLSAKVASFLLLYSQCLFLLLMDLHVEGCVSTPTGRVDKKERKKGGGERRHGSFFTACATSTLLAPQGIEKVLLIIITKRSDASHTKLLFFLLLFTAQSHNASVVFVSLFSVLKATTVVLRALTHLSGFHRSHG